MKVNKCQNSLALSGSTKKLIRMASKQFQIYNIIRFLLILISNSQSFKKNATLGQENFLSLLTLTKLSIMIQGFVPKNKRTSNSSLLTLIWKQRKRKHFGQGKWSQVLSPLILGIDSHQQRWIIFLFQRAKSKKKRKHWRGF